MTEVRDQGPASSSFTDPIASLRLALRGHYEIERQIGQGAFATVYLARDLKHERKVAIKVLNADPTSDTGELRFIREIRLVARLQHPNILPLHDSGHVEAMLYYVMPYVQGETLRIRMHRERQMGVEPACAIARETADALAHAHSQGIVHRDIKPENILLSGGHAIVADFGIARAIDIAGVKQLTVTGVAGPGTPAYMSPEQLLGDRAVDARSDIYSLGCVLYEMLAGKPPFPGKEGFVKRFTEPPPHISSLRRDAPPWLDRVLAKALSKDPDDRYATAADLVAALCQPATATRTPARDTPLKNALASPPLFESDPLEAQEFAKAFPDSYPSPGLKGGGAAPSVSLPRRGAASAAKESEAGWAARASHRLRLHPRIIGGSFAFLLISALLLRGLATPAWSNAFGRAMPIDSTRVAVLPFAGDGASTLGQEVADDLYDAFSQWEGLPLVADTRIAQAIAKNGGPPLSESDALSLARQLGAGKLVWGQATGKPGAARVRVHLYDVVSGDSKDEFAFVDSTTDAQVYPPVALRLLRLAGRPRAADGGDGLTRSYPAWSAYGRGHLALAKWDLPGADREFREAVRADGAYAPARLWLGQLAAWRAPERREEWTAAAIRASTDIARLDARDRLVASGLSALANRRYPEACTSYSQLTARDSRDFVGWYGLGECQSLDSAVVPATTSPSRWSFRTSYRAAANAYVQALEIEPGAHAVFNFRRLRDMLPTASTRVRVGTSDPPNRQTFAAYPSLAERGDTLAFIPYPMSSFATLPPQAMRSRNLALERNADELLRFATSWTRRLPSDPAAHETLADVLEISGDIMGEPFRETAVMQALRRARALSRDPHQLTRVAAREVRLRFKREEFTEARRLADSLLAANPQPNANDARVLIPIAALTGKLDLAVRLGKLSHPFLPRSAASMPSQVREAAVELFVSAALGICGPRISSLEKQLDDQLVRYVPAERATDLHADLLRRPLSLTVPCNGGESALRISKPRDRLVQMQQAFASGRLPLVRALLDTLAEIERLGRPGDMSVDHTFQQAWVRSAIGDTTGAIRVLDNTLGALPALSADNLGEVAAAAAVGRAMALRAHLAAAGKDWRRAERLGRALTALWATADPPLKPLLDDVRSVARMSANR